MKSIKTYFRQVRNSIKKQAESSLFMRISCDKSPDIFMQKALEYKDKKITIHNNIDKSIQASIKYTSAMRGFGFNAYNLRNNIISWTLMSEYFFCFCANESKDVIVLVQSENKELFKNIIDRISAVFLELYETTISIDNANKHELDELLLRADEAENFYIHENGDWTQNFINKLGDELSQASFRSFLLQRVKAHTLWGYKTLYPIAPPSQSAQWRKERQENPPYLPLLEKCSTGARDFFYLHTYIYEQYGIENVVEAKAGDIVIDAGAYIADTALYFSKKIGEEGKVYAFDGLEANVIGAEHNLKINNICNVEMIPYALAEKRKQLYFRETGFLPDSSSIFQETGNKAVQAISIDEFTDERNIKLDFLKVDIEGGEMNLLHGAVRTISNDKPICTIALYHKQSDYFEIPQILEKLCPDYTFYFRCEAEPVLFAKVKYLAK